MGRVGAEKVFALLRHEEVERHEITPTTIIKRDSIGPAPRSRLRA